MIHFDIVMILNGPKLVNQVENLKNTKYHYSQPIVLNYDIANRHPKTTLLCPHKGEHK